MSTPNEGGFSDAAPWVAILGGLGLLALKSWISKMASNLNPWKLAQHLAVSLNEPLMQKHMGPIHARFDEGDRRMGAIEEKVTHVQRVMDHLPGADAAHEAVGAEDRARSRWSNG